jgi:hypothetical protein
MKRRIGMNTILGTLAFTALYYAIYVLLIRMPRLYTAIIVSIALFSTFLASADLIIMAESLRYFLSGGLIALVAMTALLLIPRAKIGLG